MPFILPNLPYAPDAFGSVLSAETFEYHHGKHHKAYVDKTNELAAKAGLEGRKLSEVIQAAHETGNQALFNNSGQLWNHSFFWQSLTPRSQRPSGELADRIQADFGSVEALVKALHDEGVGHFASGWAWLVLERDKLKVTSLHDGDTPVVRPDLKPLLTVDLWEHAYYIDYRNFRPKYLESILNNALAWDFAAANLDGRGMDRADQQP
ncbi:MAG: superoxide dismutase [Novosphingobium sp.]